ncbi:MAG TPA: nuclear transport factor 2 family protein [Stellaceae bacterium]|nr:nuclear transport factor 2 family protein [Stellaceae bacterium]
MDPSAVRSVADKQAIANVLAVHSRGIDRRDEALLRSAYHDDGAVAYGFFDGPAADFCRILTQGLAGQPITTHRSALPWIKLDGDRAKSETYVVAYVELPLPTGAVQCLIGGRYLDHLERRDGAWRITLRTYVLDWNVNQPSTVSWNDGMYAQLNIRGAAGEADPSRALFSGWLEGAAAGHSSSRGAGDAAGLAASVDKQALHDLLMAYGRAMDRTDEPLLRSIWHEGATVSYGIFDGDAQEFSRFILESNRPLKRAAHSVVHEWFEIRGDQAVGEIYAFTFATAPGADGDEDSLVGGRFIDRFERRHGVWKITHRTFALDWAINQPCSVIWDGDLYGSLKLRGRSDTDDPVYAFWQG